MHWTVDGKKTILVRNVTTDSASFVGVQMAMKEFMKDSWTVRRVAVPIHQGQSPFKQGMKAIPIDIQLTCFLVQQLLRKKKYRKL